MILSSGLSVAQLINTAWASASTFKSSDLRGGANGASLNLAPQKDWAIDTVSDVSFVIATLEGIKENFKGSVSLADLIVLGGCAALEKPSGVDVPFIAGRTDAFQEQTEVLSFAVLEPTYDGFRNYKNTMDLRSTEALLVDKAKLLSLTAPQITVLVAGLRSLGANAANSKHGVFTDKPGTLNNDFFVNLLDMNIQWQAIDALSELFESRDRRNNALKFTATRADLVFGSNAILRSIAEVYAQSDGEQKFINDFIAAWNKVMNLDRFDLG